MALDTLGYVKELEAAGVDRKVAEAHATALLTKILPDLPTKTDIADLRTEIWRAALATALATTTLVTFLMKLL